MKINRELTEGTFQPFEINIKVETEKEKADLDKGLTILAHFLANRVSNQPAAEDAAITNLIRGIWRSL